MDAIEAVVDRSINRRAEIDYLLLADHAAVVQGKLYLSGGGWDRVSPAEFPHQMMIGIAAGIRVPYTETDDPHSVGIRLESGSNAEALSDAELATMAVELSRILDYANSLSEVDVTDIPPMTHAVPIDGPLRTDEVGPMLSGDAVRANAPSMREV